MDSSTENPPSSNTETPLRRRNGRKQACEPCRQRKVACDHRTPVCQRCKRGKFPNNCIYLVPGRGSTSSRATPQSLAPLATETVPRPKPTQTPGYLGATSFSAVLQETQDNLLWRQTPPVPSEDSMVEPSRLRDGRTPFTQRRSNTGVAVLRSIPIELVSYMLFTAHVNPNDGWCRLAGKRLLESLWTAFGARLEDDASASSLSDMADRLSQNSQTPLEDEFLGPEEWVQAFSGINLRWEALGILFTYWSFGALSLTDGSSIVATKADRQALFLDYKENAWKCAELARDCSASNPLLVYLLYKHSLLESVHSGDASLAYWRLHADVIAVLTYLGLHNIPPKLSSQVSISLEVRRRLFAAVFNIDKVVATFTGRLPLLSRKYCSTPLPFDMDDESLLSRSTPLADTIQRLDEKGWGCDGKIHATTILRARTTLAFIRDAILEIALGPSPDCNKDALLELKQQQKDAILHFPEAVVYRPHDLLDLTIDAPSLYTKLLVRLEHLQNLFFIERLLRRAESPSSAALVEISIEMVSLTLTFWTHQDRLLGLQSDFEWLVMSYAAPAGGIMCMELLEQSQAHISVRAGLKRSLIVQKLSLLVGFLDWVRSSAPNGDLCSKVKSVIRHVLEETLETVQVLPGGQFDLGVDNWEESLDLDEFFNFDLMDTFDWLRPNGGSIRE